MLHDGEFIAAEARDEILRPDRLAQPLGNALEVFVADQMSERIVCALEFVDVDIEDREPDASSFEQQSLDVALKQGSIRQIGQRVVMRETLDPRFHAATFGHVLERGGPAAIRRALVDQADAPPVGRRNHGVANLVIFRIEEIRAIFVDIADERAALLAMQDQIPQMTAGPCHLGRNAEHVDIALIADHEARRSVEQQQALGHVVDGGVEVLALWWSRRSGSGNGSAGGPRPHSLRPECRW